MWQETVVLLMVIISTMVDPATGVSTRCVTGTFTNGSRAFVTCLFNVDLKATKRNFNVVHYAKSATGDSDSVQKTGNYVLLCNWVSEQPVCETDPGFRFNKDQVSDQLVLNIPSVTRDHEGLYACQMVPDDLQISTCTLSVEDGHISNNTSPEPTLHEVANRSNEGYLAWAIVMTLLCVFIVVTMVFITCRRTDRKTLEEGTQGTPRWTRFIPCCQQRFSKLATGKDNRISVKPSVDVSLGEGAYDDERTTSPLMVEAEQQETSMDETDQTVQLPAPSEAVYSRDVTSVGSQTSAPLKRHFSVQASVACKCQEAQTQKQVTLAETWDAHDIRYWLQEVSVDRYKALLATNLTGKNLLTLNHKSELKKMGIEGDDAQWLKEKINNLITVNKQLAAEAAELDKEVQHRTKQRRPFAIVSSL